MLDRAQDPPLFFLFWTEPLCAALWLQKYSQLYEIVTVAVQFRRIFLYNIYNVSSNMHMHVMQAPEVSILYINRSTAEKQSW